MASAKCVKQSTFRPYFAGAMGVGEGVNLGIPHIDTARVRTPPRRRHARGCGSPRMLARPDHQHQAVEASAGNCTRIEATASPGRWSRVRPVRVRADLEATAEIPQSDVQPVRVRAGSRSFDWGNSPVGAARAGEGGIRERVSPIGDIGAARAGEAGLMCSGFTWVRSRPQETHTTDTRKCDRAQICARIRLPGTWCPTWTPKGRSVVVVEVVEVSPFVCRR